MKQPTVICGILFICLSFHAQSQSNRFSDFRSLIGSWRSETKKGILFENWQKVNDSSFRSQSYRVNERDTVHLESVSLIYRGEKIIYVPTVPGENENKPVPFVLSSFIGDTCIFENSAHDFPQRIIYVLPSNNQLHAWIEGTINDKFKKIDYFYTKGN